MVMLLGIYITPDICRQESYANVFSLQKSLALKIVQVPQKEKE